MPKEKTNPKKIPKTQADCKKAFEDGVKNGSNTTSTIFLTVLLDHFGFDQQKIVKCYHAVMKLSTEIAEHYVSISDLRHVLLEEYGIQV